MISICSSSDVGNIVLRWCYERVKICSAVFCGMDMLLLFCGMNMISIYISNKAHIAMSKTNNMYQMI